MKYSTPSIEVVNFNSSDAPRIGMQWWYGVTYNPRTWDKAPAGFTPTNITNQWTEDFPALGFSYVSSCTAVTVYTCDQEVANLPNAFSHTDGNAYIVDDMRSC